ncbi:GMC oxidoreductase [Diaporthe helianthi]|uniref:GMC oxidoreductase n=1 Tax=Diaporthe helianthi TaxID=158607 RepID=A0A2P5IFS2_DIAHE|nr:GMC oxidoreductase [Diaporthe helianthi]
MISRTLLAAAAMATGVLGQQSTVFTDDKSGIKFSYYQKSGWGFGLALPEAPKAGGDFIGILQSNTVEGYAAVSLGGPMANSLLLTAWADGDKMVGSLRKASGYTNPSPVTDASMGMYEIAEGTAINATGWQYTFLCKGCITDDSESFTVDAEADIFGYALSKTALTDTSDAAAILNYHGAAFGEYSHSLTDAKSAEYETWAALASTTTGGSSSGPVGGSAQNITTTTSNATYDYIVAGGGAAGLVVSQRLVESGASVLLLERGAASTYSTGGDATVPYNDTITQYDVPAMAYYLTQAPDTSEYCLDTASMAGCILGGSTMVNALMFVKPAAHDFDDKWPTGWKWSDVSSSADAFYERSPGFILQNGTGVDMDAFHVMSGFLDKQGWSHVNALEDPNAKEKIYSHPPWLIQDGLRGGPIRSYLPLAMAQSNFKLSLNTKLVRVIRKGATATGVEVELSNGNRQIINLNNGGKVVLAGGALSTPRMLINSGIGPKAQIETVKTGSAKVTLPDEADWIELPVGDHLMDHPIFTVTLKVKDGLPALPETAFTSPNATVATEFNTKSAGLLAQSGQRINIWNTVQSDDGATYYVQGTINAPSANTIKVKVYLTHGITTTGTLGITASGATEITKQPYLTNPGDKSAITNFMNELIEMVNGADSPFTPLNTTAEALIAEDNMKTGSHFVGTARMGAANDGSSVVDTNTKVWGTDNIYVVDASMHPDLPTGNTQAIVMVAAEHAAKVILADTTGASSSSNATDTSSGCKRRRSARKL